MYASNSFFFVYVMLSQVVFVPWWGKLWKRTFQSAVAVDLEELLSHETLKRFVEHDKGSNSLQEPVVPDQVQ